jgi:hypothetical protein
MRSKSKGFEPKKDDGYQKEYECCEYGYGIYDSNIVGFAVAIANVTDADFCNAQANAAVLVAGDDIDAKFENETQVQQREE